MYIAGLVQTSAVTKPGKLSPLTVSLDILWMELVVQFPARGSTQVLLCLFPCVLWLWHFLYSIGPHPVSSLHIYTFGVSRAFMADAASQAGDADSSRAPCLISGLQGSVNVHRGALLFGATVTVHQFFCILHDIFYINFITTNIAVINFYDLSAFDDCWSLLPVWKIIYYRLNVCPFDCKAVSGNEKESPLNPALIMPVGWRLSLQLIVLSRSVILVFMLSDVL